VGVGRYIVARLLLTIPMLLILLTVVFAILRVIPGDPCSAMLGGRNVSVEQLASCRATLGVDRPVVEQYASYLGQILRGDLGTSIRTGLSVSAELLERFPATMELALVGMAVATIVGMATGVIAATRSDRPADHAIRLLNIASFAMPIFWIGLMFISIFAVRLRWLPVGGRLDPVAGASFEPLTRFYVLDALLRGDLALLADVLRHLLMPSVTLGLVLSGIIGRISRTSMLEVLGQDYVRTARAKGLVERLVVGRHAMRNALIPIVTVIGLQFALLMGGAVLTETVYSWPGIARYLLDSIENRDFPAIQGTVVFIALFIAGANLVVDVLYARLDPRVRF
jgi:peptide/nickel transport system permease protein